jgi:hypothetical protein
MEGEPSNLAMNSTTRDLSPIGFMEELASITVGTVAVCVELVAFLGLIVSGDVSFLSHFMDSMGECTL